MSHQATPHHRSSKAEKLLLKQPIDQRDLAQANPNDKRPDKPFAQAQATLTVITETKAELG